MSKLLNKVALVTGGSSGIGKAIVELFLQEGATVFFSYQKKNKELDSTLHELKKISKNVYPVHLEMTSLVSIKEMIDTVIKKTSKLDILVNSAGVYIKNTFLETTEKIWDNTMDVNLKGTYFCSRYACDYLIKQKESSIISIASIAGCFPRESHIEYAIAKAGVVHFSKCLALAISPVRVNCIAPSYTFTKFMPEMKDKNWVKKKKSIIPLKDFNTPEDIANATLFLASKDSRMITGQVIVIDGGRGGQI